MSNYIERIKSELTELNNKLEKLNNFIANDAFMQLSTQKQELLRIQLAIMEAYVRIIKLRINLAVETLNNE